MREAPLDRPVWHALATRHAPMAIGGPDAKRYPSDVSPFIAARDDTDASLAAMVPLVGEGESAVLLQREPSPVPPGLVAEFEAGGVQMIATELASAGPCDDVVELGKADAPEMLQLATLTKPGPFKARTNRFGGYIGIRVDGRLVAMAGERLKVEGFSEVSGVCTHPDYRGRGYAGRLSLIVAHRIAHRGETPFLHAYTSNAGAIRLYEKLGFRYRCDMTVQVMKRM